MSARTVLRATGLMNACIQMVPHCMLYVRPLTMYLLEHYIPGRDSVQKAGPSQGPYVPLSPVLRDREDQPPAGGLSLGSGTPLVVIYTDASLQVWGLYGVARR